MHGLDDGLRSALPRADSGWLVVDYDHIAGALTRAQSRARLSKRRNSSSSVCG